MCFDFKKDIHKNHRFKGKKNMDLDHNCEKYDNRKTQMSIFF
jgi:hypothetical protein